MIFKSLTVIWLMHQSASNSRLRLLPNDSIDDREPPVIDYDHPIVKFQGEEEVQTGFPIGRGINAHGKNKKSDYNNNYYINDGGSHEKDVL